MSEQKEQNERVFTPETWVYIGRREGAKKTILNRFMPLINGELSDEAYGYELKRTDFIIGGIYTVPVDRTDGDTIIRSGMFEFVEIFSDENKLQEWKLNERIFKEKQKDDRLMKKYQKEGEFELPERLDDIIRAYRKLRGTERRYFFAILERALEYKKID